MPMNIVLRILENIQDILLACPVSVKYEHIWNITAVVLDLQACYASFILYIQIYKVRPKTDLQCEKDKKTRDQNQCL